MQNYVEAKIGEFSEKLSYQRAVLTELSQSGAHPVLVKQLFDICDESERLVQRASQTLALNLPQLFRRLQIDLSQVRAKLERLEEFYLPALLHEGDEERAVARIIDRLLKQLQAPKMADKVVSFSRALSVYPGIAECPVFFMLRYTPSCLLEWTGIYHEIGHTVYNQFPEIRMKLSNSVLAYCQNQLQYTPALSASQLNNRAERLRKVVRYWDPYRLAELFCYVFGTVVAGPAHLLSWIDLAVISQADPYQVDPADEHPPDAARTQVCMLALDDAYANAPLKRAIGNLWDSYAARRPQGPLFNQMCAFPLLMSLVQTARAEIARCNFPTFRTVLPSPPKSLDYDDIDDLQMIVNVAAVNLMFAPAEYTAWQRRIKNKMLSCVKQEGVDGHKN